MDITTTITSGVIEQEAGKAESESSVSALDAAGRIMFFEAISGYAVAY